MPMVCRICSHSDRLAIDRALCSGQNKVQISRAYSVPYASLFNHEAHHLNKQLTRSHKAKDLLNADSLMDEALSMIDRVKDIETLARNGNLLGTGLKAIAELRSSLEFLIKLGLSLQKAIAEEKQSETRQQADELKANLSRREMEVLHILLLKSKSGFGPELLSMQWSEEPSYCSQAISIVPQEDDPTMEDSDSPDLDDPPFPAIRRWVVADRSLKALQEQLDRSQMPFLAMPRLDARFVQRLRHASLCQPLCL